MNNYSSLKVFYNNVLVGTLARTADYRVAFEYDDDWIIKGFSISPLSLPLEKRVFIPKYEPFNGLYGVFDDSLPDGWGRLVVDRFLLKQGVNPALIDNLNRLAIVQNSGMGALTYHPVHAFNIEEKTDSDLDMLAIECHKILEGDVSGNLDEIFLNAGSSGGARPKILTKVNGEDWIIKFPSSLDTENIGEVEYNYSICAKKCGIKMPETKLFESKTCSGYFGVKRFDRLASRRVHMVSAGGLLESSHRLPNLDYNILMKLTFMLTNSYENIEQLYRLMCFNVFAHNRDDHAKNFSYIYNEQEGRWHLSPAYDLTYSNSLGGEHATTINGEGKNPEAEDILTVAKNIGIEDKKAKNIMHEIEEIVHSYGLG